LNSLDVVVLSSAAAYLLLRLVFPGVERNWRLLILELTGVLLLLAFLHWGLGMFDSSSVAKGTDSDDLLHIVLLYLSMVLGMLGQYLYSWLKVGERAQFKVREFLGTCFIAPAVFIPFYNTIKGSWNEPSMRWLVYFVAYENGFFFKNTLDQGGKTRAKSSPQKPT
jgi:hypothetical protein